MMMMMILFMRLTIRNRRDDVNCHVYMLIENKLCFCYDKKKEEDYDG